MDNRNVDLIHKETIVKLCDRYRVEITQGEEHIMIFHPGVPISLAERPLLSKYLTECDYKIGNMVSYTYY